MAKKKKKHFSIIGLFFKIIFVIVLAFLYSYYVEPKMISYKEYEIKGENITDNFKGFKIVQISDIHYGRVYDKKLLKKLVESVNRQEADIVVLTGDLIDKSCKMDSKVSDEIASELSKIDAPIGKYAVSGDNDLKFDEWTNIISGSGFTNLNNSYDTIYKKGYNFMVIAGVSSYKDKLGVNDKLTETVNFLNSFEKDGPIYKILLMHEPDTIDEIENNTFDLVLSGHSLHGQVKLVTLPLFLPNGARKYYGSHYEVNGSQLYVSNGLGTTDFDFRLFNTPSFNIYKFNK